MKAERDSVSERIWTYLHGECDAEARREFEQEVARSDELRAELDRARRFDRVLRAALPALSEQNLDDEAFAAQALTAWEHQRGTAPCPVRANSARRLVFSPAFKRFAAGFSSLAAVAALIVVVTQNFRTPQQARWEDPTLIPLAWRGPDMQAGGHAMDAHVAQRCQEALMASVSRVAATRGVALPPGLVFSMRVQELRDGAFSVCVRMRSHAGHVVGEWDGLYSGLAAFFKQADTSADRIVGEVSSLFGNGGQGGRP